MVQFRIEKCLKCKVNYSDSFDTVGLGDMTQWDSVESGFVRDSWFNSPSAFCHGHHLSSECRMETHLYLSNVPRVRKRIRLPSCGCICSYGPPLQNLHTIHVDHPHVFLRSVLPRLLTICVWPCSVHQHVEHRGCGSRVILNGMVSATHGFFGGDEMEETTI